jgi:hypothetical protein
VSWPVVSSPHISAELWALSSVMVLDNPLSADPRRAAQQMGR